MTETRPLSKHERALELDKVLAMLADQATCDGSRALALALRPQTRLSAIQAELARVSDAYTLSIRYGAPSLGGIRDMTDALLRAKAGGILTLPELLGVKSLLRSIRTVKEWRAQAGDAPTSLDLLFEGLVPQRAFEERLANAILSEETLADDASPELASIRYKIRQAGMRIREQLDRMIKSPTYQKYLQDALVTIRDGRFVVPVKVEYRSEIKGLVHDTSGSGATVFIEPMAVVEANNEIKVLEGKEKEEITRILAEFSEIAGGLCDLLTYSYENMLEIDLCFARANLGVRMKGTVPLVSDDRVIDLHAARHPLIPAGKVVPIDIRVGADFTVLVITGPNTGGKTVALKTLGLITLMAMCGMMIPAGDESRVSVFSHVLADIGDEQSIEQSLSTFSAHMTTIIEILKLIDENSLVLLDELGAGTDPVEGAALAIAIIERIKAAGSRVAATTHYAEIKQYALANEGIENASCEFDVATLRPTYRLLIGLPGRSNAFAISERLGIEPGIVERARELVSREDTQFEDIVSELEATRTELEQEKDRVRATEAAAEEAKREADRTLQRVRQEQERALEKARGDAKRLVEMTRMQTTQLMDELIELRKAKNSEDFASRVDRARSELKSRLDRIEDTANPVAPQKPRGKGPSRPLNKGDRVVITDIGKQGIVIAPPDKSGMVQVQAGIVKTSVPVYSLELVPDKKTAPQKGGTVTRQVASRGETKIEDEINVMGHDRRGGADGGRPLYRRGRAIGHHHPADCPRQGHRGAAQRHPALPAGT